MNKNNKKNQKPNTKGLVDPKMVKEYKVYVETTLLEFLYFKMPTEPKKNVKRILANHQVSVGGAPVSQFDFKLYPEDVVVVSRNRIAKRTRKDLPILYEDDEIIAIDKPSGLLSVATEREKGRTAYRLVSDYVTSKNPKDRIFVVHRLDEDTSGVLIFAKNWEIREALQNNWQTIVKKRGYYAIVEGEMEKEEATLKDELAENSMQLVYVCNSRQKGKLAITHYKLIKQTKNYALLDIDIATGRKNQIRVQLGHRGHYVIGDDKYGEPSDPLKRLGLHAYELEFIHPITNKVIDIVSPMPQTFKDLIFQKSKKQGTLVNTAESKQQPSKNMAKYKKSKANSQYHKFKKKK